MRSIERTRILHNAPPPCGEHHPFFTFNCVFCQKLIVLNIQLFGSPVAYDSDEQQHLPLTKPALLLFYLAYYGQWMTREELAFFFRPEADESTARSYVRKLLNSAKKMPWAQGLEIESERLRWQVDTDIARFLDAFHNGRWYEAIEYYNGDFLKGVTDVGLLSYDAWIDTEREALANKWHTAVLNYANDLEASEQHLEAADTVKRILNQDEFAEDAENQLSQRDFSLLEGRA